MLPPPAKPHPGRVILVLAGLALVPFVLTAWIGAPIPHDWPTAQQWDSVLRGLTIDHFHALGRILLWAAWLAVLIGSIWEITTYLTHRNRPTAPARKPWFLRLTSALTLGTTATTALTAATPAVAMAETPDTAHDTKESEKGATPQSRTSPMPSSTADTGTATKTGGESTYTVQSGDTLWDIATTELNDPAAWTALYQLNKNQAQPDGGRLTDPNLIQPGWQLDLPPQATDEPPSDPQPPDDEQPHADPSSPTDDQSIHDAPTHDSDTQDESGHGPDWVWWVGGFVSTAFAAGLAVHVRNARRRVRSFEQRTGRTGPRIRLAKPLDELESTSNADFAGIDTSQSAALGVADNGAGIPILAAAAGGLGLDGPGAEAAARAAVAAALVDGDQDATSQGCDVFITSPAMAQLLDDEQPPAKGIHRLWIYPTSELALRKLSREILARARDPEPVTAPILLVLDDEADRAVLASLTRQSQHLGIGALILGDWPDNTITINTDGTSNSHDIARCSILTTAAFTATLSTLDGVREAYDEPIAPPAERDDDLDGDSPAAIDVADTDATDEPVEANTEHLDSGHGPINDETAGRHDQSGSPRDAVASSKLPPQPEPRDPVGKPLRLRLLGDFDVTYRDEPIRIRRAKSQELLACLAAQDHPATRDYLLEAIVAETVVPKARQHLESIVTNTRKDLREATGEPNTTKFILYTDNSYRLDPDWFTTDLAAFDQHIAGAAAASDQAVKLKHLAAALEMYTGEVAADVDTESIWPHPIRAHYADLAHAACLTLAESTANRNDHDTAIEWLERAININRYNEDAYTSLIRIHKEHGDTDNATKIYNRLKTSLAAIGATPSPGFRPQRNSP